MQIKKSVIEDVLPKHRLPEEGKIREGLKNESAAAKSVDKPSVTTGMSFFEQSIYAIEEFISLRRKMGPHTWK